MLLPRKGHLMISIKLSSTHAIALVTLLIIGALFALYAVRLIDEHLLDAGITVVVSIICVAGAKNCVECYCDYKYGKKG